MTNVSNSVATAKCIWKCIILNKSKHKKQFHSINLGLFPRFSSRYHGELTFIMLYVTHVRLCIFFLCEVWWKKVKFLHQFQVRLSKRIRMILTWLNYSHTDRIYACISIKKSSLWIETFPFFLCWFQRSWQHWLKRSKMTTNVFFSILLCWTHKSLSS